MMAMALGAGQAHAQAIDAGEATFTPRTNTVMITPGGLWGTENDDTKEAVMADFTVNVRPATGDPVAQTITSYFSRHVEQPVQHDHAYLVSRSAIRC